MLINACVTLYRISVRHPLYTLLNLVGLGLGIAVFLILALYVRFETGFERSVPDVGRIYQLGTLWTLPGRPVDLTAETMGGLLDEVHEDYPDLIGARIWHHQATVRLGADPVHEQEALVDPDFFKVFDLALVAGDKATALSGPDKILVTAATARKYFGTADAVGKTLRLADFEGDRSYVVSAVLADLPHNSDLTLNVVRLMTASSVVGQTYWRHWGSAQLATYLHLSGPVEAKRLAAAFDGLIDRKAGDPASAARIREILQLRLMRLRDVHLRDPQSRNAVATLGLVGLLSFLVAAINFVNLSTARAELRAREVAVRRSLGATRADLGRQFLAEAALSTLVAALFALSLVELTLPLINAAGGLDLALDYRGDGPFLLVLLGIVLGLGVLAGIYPAVVLSGFAPAQVLAASRTPGGGRLGLRVREALVVLQFSVVIAFFVLTWGFDRQIRHMQTADLGFQRERLLLIPSTRDPAMTDATLPTVLAALRVLPGVVAVTIADNAPGDDQLNNALNVRVPGTDREIHLGNMEVGPDFFPTYGAHLLAGRFLDATHPADQTAAFDTVGARMVTVNVVINARALGLLGFTSAEEALGRTLFSGSVPLMIVGVVEDLRFHSGKSETVGAFYYFNATPRENQIAALRYAGVAEPEMRRRVAEAWRSVAPDCPLEMISANDNLDSYYRSDRNQTRLFGLGALVAAMVGCVGLYGMAAFSTSRRMLEVAVRKVLGAPRGRVVWLLVGQFLRPVLLANVIAAPISVVVLGNWLTRFSDPIRLDPVPFLLAGGGALAVAVVTVATLAFVAASAEPGRALRHD
jgi:putative ABC transport system permease protein